MTNKEEQQKAGIAEQPRGQRMGRGNDLDENRYEKEAISHHAATPALRGERPESSEHFADDSTQHIGSDSVTPRSNTPSVPAAIPTNTKFGESGGEAEFKQRQEGK